ncbi:hypothetical protein NA56DRAFT_705912 [Hyaloscypha hepaticicola]|uniref:Uncharacterized protein n=1 Tax=Hyaloscypha hepaticicola TaxID=2082293 RepID=A0A2J6PZ53_9HELO|nr:hypothetical protein NA56DRAFT_705912 [Hyaloscypha hepaticicola]
MLQPAFYRKRKRIAMYAAANITILIEYCALAGNSHVGTGHASKGYERQRPGTTMKLQGSLQLWKPGASRFEWAQIIADDFLSAPILASSSSLDDNQYTNIAQILKSPHPYSSGGKAYFQRIRKHPILVVIVFQGLGDINATSGEGCKASHYSSFAHFLRVERSAYSLPTKSIQNF